MLLSKMRILAKTCLNIIRATFSSNIWSPIMGRKGKALIFLMGGAKRGPSKKRRTFEILFMRWEASMPPFSRTFVGNSAPIWFFHPTFPKFFQPSTWNVSGSAIPHNFFRREVEAM